MASLPLSTACAVAGVLMVFGAAGEPAQTHQTVAAHSPATPEPVEPHKAQQPQKAQQAQKAQPASDAAFYKTCPEAHRPGPPPRHSGAPGYGSALDRDRDGKACER